MEWRVMEEKRIGAHLIAGGCHFRVWAPHATLVRVLIQRGDAWDTGRETRMELLVRDGDGFWNGLVPDVGAGTLYRFEITHGGAVRQRLDPAARDVVHSGLTRSDPENRNASIVVSGGPHPWAPFTTPGFENFIIYQFHVGSFAGRNDGLNREIATFSDIESKLPYIQSMGFSAIQPLPVQEFAFDRSWGYNPASFFAPESAYGSPADLRRLVDAAHRHGLAVIFDVVYNHAGRDDNVLWAYDGYEKDGGIYFEGGRSTPWGPGPAWWKREVQDFFHQNARMYFEEYNADGLRFDVTTQIDGNHLKEVMWRLHQEFPRKYMIAEHLPADPWITTQGNFDATWFARSHHECQRALAGQNPVNRVKSFLGWEGFQHPWNLIKYSMGCHDDIGDADGGNAQEGLSNWDRRHRYLIDQLGGRGNWHGRAKCRLAWALNIAMPGTPMLFMGSECHMGAPGVAWGYWHDGRDQNGDHRFDWSLAEDSPGMEMRRLVAAANRARWENPALRGNTLIITHEDHYNNVLAFKRWHQGNLVLAVVNLGDRSFENHGYGVGTDWQYGQWTQILCTQDASFGGWDWAGNAYHDPWTQSDGRIYINLPGWSVLLFRLK